MSNLNNRFLIILILPFLLANGDESSSMSSVCIARYNHTKTNTNPSTTLDTFQTNLQTLFGYFRTNGSIYSHSVAGKPPNQAYGFYLCRGDTTSDVCTTCVASLTEWIIPTHDCREAFAYADYCMVHYANYSFLGKEINNTAPGGYTIEFGGKPGAANFGEYNRTVEGVVEGLVAEVGNVSAALTVRYGTREGRVGNGREKVYGLAQCVPDISQRDCSGCLKAAFSAIQGCCGGGKDAWAMFPSCQLRYDNASFYVSAATVNSTAVSATFSLVATWVLLLIIDWLIC